MVTTAEYIQIIAAGIYAIALFYTIVTVRRTKRLDQITLSDRIFTELENWIENLLKYLQDLNTTMLGVNPILGYLIL
jgi:hypothetical protein